jgi:hypothetical protein
MVVVERENGRRQLINDTNGDNECSDMNIVEAMTYTDGTEHRLHFDRKWAHKQGLAYSYTRSIFFVTARAVIVGLSPVHHR